MWSASDIAVRERAAAVERCFTNGTPILIVVAVLGTNYGVLRPFSSVWVGPGPEPRKTCSLLYYFGQDSVTIGTSADIGGDPLTGEFNGAGYSLPVTPLPPASNRTRIGQPRRSSEREPADSLRDKSNVIGGWLPSPTFAFAP